jgi:KaiC/GvpD/RAD55 family RecA-like ATPase
MYKLNGLIFLKGRTRIGITGLDKALNGGFPTGNLVLISGGAGTGKSTLCLQFCVNGCEKFGEKALYISTEQTPDELYRQGDQYNWPLKDLIDKGKLRIDYFDVTKGTEYLNEIEKSILTFKPNRIVLDSLTTLADALLVSDLTEDTAFSMVQVAESVNPIPRTEQIITKTLLYRLTAELKKHKITTLLTTELPEDMSALSADGVSEFITDGVVVLYYTGIAGATSQSLRVRKMRYTSHAKSYLPYNIASTGIELDESDSTDILMK